MKRLLCFAVLITSLVILRTESFAQKNHDEIEIFHPQVIPPAPTVSTLGKYGDVPINLATGAPTISIPLYTLSYRNASLPISLSYSSNGVKVDAIASWVGQEWTLNAGGIVSRTVRGGADEDSRCHLPEVLDQYSPETVDFLQYQWDHTTDTEPDIFNYNFDGHTGKFIIDVEDSMRVYTIPYNNLKIKVNYVQTDYTGIFSFEITTPDGVKYLFGEEYFDCSNTRSCNIRTYDRDAKTAWHLKNIEYPTGEEINLAYKRRRLSYYAGISQTIRKFMTTNCDDPSQCPEESNTTCALHLTTRTWHLDSITTTDYQKVKFYSTASGRSDFNDVKLDSIKAFNSRNALIKNITLTYTFPRTDMYFPSSEYNGDGTLYYRMFLAGISIKGSDKANPQNYDFGYENINNLPSRLSFAQDHWGYFNGVQNTDFIDLPDYLENLPNYQNIHCDREPVSSYTGNGVLNKITYPTSGYDTLEYEQNTYSGSVFVNYTKDLELTVSGDSCWNYLNDSVIYTVPITQSQYINAGISCTENGCGACISHHGRLSVYDQTTSTYLISSRFINFGSPVSIPVDYTEGHIYKARISAQGKDVDATFITSFDTLPPSWQQVEKYTGGVRIKRVTAVDNITKKRQVTRYYYGNLENINVSSGVFGGNPIYVSPQTIKLLYNQQEQVCYHILLYSNSVNNLYNVNGSNIMYENVIISHGEDFENGGELNHFLVENDEPGYIVAWTTNEDNILGATKSNQSWNNGLQKSQLIFKKQGSSIVPLKETINIFIDDARKDKTFHGYVFRKIYDQIFHLLDEYTCTQQDVDYTSTICDTPHNHWWWCVGTDPICIAPGANNIPYNNPCQSLYQVIKNYNSLDNIDGIKYDIYCKWNHLDTVKTKTFSVSGQDSITETSVYSYGNPLHALPNLVKYIDSKGDTIKSYTYFPQDYSKSAISGNFQAMVNKHIIGATIDKRQFVNEKLSSGQTTLYNEYGQPREIFMARNELGTNLAFNEEIPYSYGIKETELQYDTTTHNLQSYKPENNIPVHYLWGYHNAYPIAEITGSSYEEITGIIQHGGFDLTTLQQSTDTTYINDATSYLRDNLSTAMVVSYTFNPQVGMISKTDAAGIKTRFEYDSSGRLAFIKDNKGNIMKKYQYHYAN